MVMTSVNRLSCRPAACERRSTEGQSGPHLVQALQVQAYIPHLEHNFYVDCRLVTESSTTLDLRLSSVTNKAQARSTASDTNKSTTKDLLVQQPDQLLTSRGTSSAIE